MWRSEIPKTWGDWHTKLRRKWIESQHARFPDTNPMTEGEMKTFLYSIEREYAREVDAVVMRFAERGRWPNNASDHSAALSVTNPRPSTPMKSAARRIVAKPAAPGSILVLLDKVDD